MRFLPAGILQECTFIITLKPNYLKIAMYNLLKLPLFVVAVFSFIACKAQEENKRRILDPAGDQEKVTILPGAYQLEEYLPMLKDKRVAIIGNQTSEINKVLLPDTLLSLGIRVVKLFSPEHGFRGDADAGKTISNSTDGKTGLPIFSLYGNHKKLPVEQLKNVDIVIYDLQDVGARFYTYISTLEYAMESCAAAGVKLIILDRPNPLGHIVDGPVLESGMKSFVGMQRIPVIYGMTPGEYAHMLKGEKWINADMLDLDVIKNRYYTHSSLYQLPVPPSPNLKNMAAIYLYPSLCLFEGTDISLGRGTSMPFQMYGHPGFKDFDYSFTPKPMPGAANPPLLHKKCSGELIAESPDEALNAINNSFNIGWILKAYKAHPNRSAFFTKFFNTLAGTNELRLQIEQGKSEEEIRASWQADLAAFKKIRKKYLLYPDFE